MDDDLIVPAAGGDEGDRFNRSGNRLANTQKNEIKPWLKQQWVSEYVRGGVSNLFMAFEPLAGWRHVEVTERKTSVDFARLLRKISDECYPKAKQLVLVCDNLSTHTPAALYEAFEPAEARRLEHDESNCSRRYNWIHHALSGLSE